jgi:hypothetical protein
VHLAQLNIARLVDDPESETVAEFMRAIGPINSLGEASPGFVWMLKDDAGVGATGQRFPGHEEDDRVIVNLTVWTDVPALDHFVHRSGHAMYLRRRREWFEKADQPTTVLWWIEEGHAPDLVEAADRLERLRAHGPTPEAFDLTTPFDATGDPT